MVYANIRCRACIEPRKAIMTELLFILMAIVLITQQNRINAMSSDISKIKKLLVHMNKKENDDGESSSDIR